MLKIRKDLLWVESLSAYLCVERMGLTLQIMNSRNCNRHVNLPCAFCQVTVKIKVGPVRGLSEKVYKFQKIFGPSSSIVVVSAVLV
jgi:hypothetical protein